MHAVISSSADKSHIHLPTRDENETQLSLCISLKEGMVETWSGWCAQGRDREIERFATTRWKDFTPTYIIYKRFTVGFNWKLIFFYSFK